MNKDNRFNGTAVIFFINIVYNYLLSLNSNLCVLSTSIRIFLMKIAIIEIIVFESCFVLVFSSSNHCSVDVSLRGISFSNQILLKPDPSGRAKTYSSEEYLVNMRGKFKLPPDEITALQNTKR